MNYYKGLESLSEEEKFDKWSVHGISKEKITENTNLDNLEPNVKAYSNELQNISHRR